MSVIINMPENI